MLKFVNAIAVTLLVAILAVVLGGFVAQEIPALAESGLHQVTVAAWVSGLLSWAAALLVAGQAKRQGAKGGAKSGKGKGKHRAVGLTVSMLALATAAVFALDRFGTGLW